MKKIFLLLFSFLLAIVSFAQSEQYQKIVDEFKKKMAAAKTMDEKKKIAAELQLKLAGLKALPVEADKLAKSKPSTAADLTKSVFCNKYKAIISFSSKETISQNCSDCGSPCPLIQNGSSNSNGNFTIVSNLCGNSGFLRLGHHGQQGKGGNQCEFQNERIHSVSRKR